MFGQLDLYFIRLLGPVIIPRASNIAILSSLESLRTSVKNMKFCLHSFNKLHYYSLNIRQGF